MDDLANDSRDRFGLDVYELQPEARQMAGRFIFCALRGMCCHVAC